jgi:hypothetical protein
MKMESIGATMGELFILSLNNNNKKKNQINVFLFIVVSSSTCKYCIKNNPKNAL